MKFETDEEFEEFLSEVESDAADFAQNLSDQSLGSIKPPIVPKGKAGKEASKEEVDSVLNQIIV